MIRMSSPTLTTTGSNCSAENRQTGLGLFPRTQPPPPSTGGTAALPQDIVVYGENEGGGVFPFKGSRWYGNLKYGVYDCKTEADAGG